MAREPTLAELTRKTGVQEPKATIRQVGSAGSDGCGAPAAALAASPAHPRAAAAPRPSAPPPPSTPDVFTVAARAIKRWFTVGNVPVKIGMLVLLAGVAALLKYASDQGWLTVPIELRLAGISAAALAGLVFGWRQRDSKRSFALAVQGGAIGVLLLTVFAAFKMYHLIPAAACLRHQRRADRRRRRAGGGAELEDAGGARHPRRLHGPDLAVHRQRQPRGAVLVLRGVERGDPGHRLVPAVADPQPAGFRLHLRHRHAVGRAAVQGRQVRQHRALPAAVLRLLPAHPDPVRAQAAGQPRRFHRRLPGVRHAADRVLAAGRAADADRRKARACRWPCARSDWARCTRCWRNCSSIASVMPRSVRRTPCSRSVSPRWRCRWRCRHARPRRCSPWKARRWPGWGYASSAGCRSSPAPACNWPRPPRCSSAPRSTGRTNRPSPIPPSWARC